MFLNDIIFFFKVQMKFITRNPTIQILKVSEDC